MKQDKFVWIFNGNLRVGGELPSGVFLSKENAKKWIDGLGIKGQLTPYPVDISVYDWAIKNQFFTPREPKHASPEFIAGFIVNYYEPYLGWVDQKLTGQNKADTLDELSPNESEGEEETISPYSEIWVYNAYAPQRTGLASAVYRTREKAEKWVEERQIDGLLTAYPVDISAYDWYVQNNLFTPKKPHHYEPYFIGTFTGGHKHFHFTHDDFGKPRWS